MSERPGKLVQDRIGVHPSAWILSDDAESVLRAVDSGIRRFMRLMLAGDFETYESCEGGEGHSFVDPTIRFHGNRGEGFRAFAWLMAHGVEPESLRRFWQIEDGEPTGPKWEITFRAGS